MQALKTVGERRGCALLAEILVSHGKFVRVSHEADRLRFTLQGLPMLSSNILRPEEKLKKKQRKTSKVLLAKLIKTNHNIFGNSVKK